MIKISITFKNGQWEPWLPLTAALFFDVNAGLFLSNIGIGPAIIRECKFSVDGREIAPGQLAEALKKELPEPSHQWVFKVTKQGSGQAIAANSESILLIGCMERPSVTEYTEFLGQLKNVRIEIVYESMYGESFGIRYVQNDKPTISFTPTR